MASMIAFCLFYGALNNSVIQLQQTEKEVVVTANLTGKVLTDGLHGFHIHEHGMFNESCLNAGAHYNPDNVTHGAPNASVHHKGDLGNLNASDGVANFKESFSFFTLSEVNGRAFVVHEKADDLGLGGNVESLKTGNAGSRLDCCMIIAEEDPTTSAPKPTEGSAPRNCQEHAWLVAILVVGVLTKKRFGS